MPCAVLFCGLALAGCSAEASVEGEEASVGGSPSATEQLAANNEEDDYFADDDYYDSLTSGEAEQGDFQDSGQDGPIIADPLRPWNYFWFKANDLLIGYVIKPISTGYEFITPSFFRQAVNNVFTNLRAPARMINCLLQGKGLEAGVEFSSFVLNSVWGLGGIMDLASKHESVVPATGEDFGQTLGRWGMGEGVYLVLPFMGPSNLRELLGMVGGYGINMVTDPMTYAGYNTYTMEIALSGIKAVNGMGDLVRTYEGLKSISLDPYAGMRDAFTKFRRAAIAK